MTSLLFLIWIRCDLLVAQPVDVIKIDGIYWCAYEAAKAPKAPFNFK